MKHYKDSNYTGTITAILLNTPLNFFGRLRWGDEVLLRCNGRDKPILDYQWIMKHLM